MSAVWLLAPAQAANAGLLDCFDFNPEAFFEGFGPTDVNVQAGNGRLTVAENKDGTISVFKYPNPSFYNQVKYLALRRDSDGDVQVEYPNEGSFGGVVYEADGRAGFAWLRGWPSTQRYDSDDTAVPVTVYRSPPALGLGLTVIDTDLVTAGGDDAFVRNFQVEREPGSPVTSARLVYFENFNPVASKLPLLPILDWCLSGLTDQQAQYDRGSHSIVHSWRGSDAATGRRTSVAFAFGWDDADFQHQVGRDGYDPGWIPGPPDGFRQTATPPYNLSGDDGALGQTTGTLSTRLRFDDDGRAEARLTVAAGPTRDRALEALERSRNQSFPTQMAAVAEEWRSWLAQTKLPASDDPRVVEVAKRSLITIRLAIDESSRAIVASSDTQGPYGQDWIRDGAFINEVLDINGYHQLVSEHNRFYARVQTSPGNPSPLRSSGNWPMNSYSDGVDGGPIPYEIDETGLGIWTLWRHWTYLDASERRSYLSDVYPAIVRAANYLTVCRDPFNGLQCVAWEDDHALPSQTLHGAGPVYLGLKSAIAAAQEMDDRGARVRRWRARLGELRAAIDSLYDSRNRAYRQGPRYPDASTVDYGDGGWLLWPVAFKPYDEPEMRGEAGKVHAAMNASLDSNRGVYEGKALLGLAYAWEKPTPEQLGELRRALSYLAANVTTNTGLFGEAWRRFADGRPRPIEDMPHVWEHALFYLAALKIEGER